MAYQNLRNIYQRLDEEHKSYLILIEQYDASIDERENLLFDVEFKDRLQNLDPSITSQFLQDIIDGCRYKNDANMKSKENIVNKLAIKLHVDRSEVSEIITELNRDELYGENSLDIQNRGDAVYRSRIAEMEKSVVGEQLDQFEEELLSLPAAQQDLLQVVLKETPEKTIEELKSEVEEAAKKEFVEEAPGRANELEKELIELDKEESLLKQELSDSEEMMLEAADNDDDDEIERLSDLQAEIEESLINCNTKRNQLTSELNLLKSVLKDPDETLKKAESQLQDFSVDLASKPARPSGETATTKSHDWFKKPDTPEKKKQDPPEDPHDDTSPTMG